MSKKQTRAEIVKEQKAKQLKELKEFKQKDFQNASLLRVDGLTFMHLLSRQDADTVDDMNMKEVLLLRDDLKLQRTGDLLHSEKYNLLLERVSNVESWVRNGGKVDMNYSITATQYLELI